MNGLMFSKVFIRDCYLKSYDAREGLRLKAKVHAAKNWFLVFRNLLLSPQSPNGYVVSQKTMKAL